AVVWPTGTTPPLSNRRWMWCDVPVALRPLNTSDASVNGHPSTGSSSLIAVGTPPNGMETSALAAAARAASVSTYVKAFRSDRSMAASVASSSSTGDRSPFRNASTSEQASPCQGVSGTPHPPTFCGSGTGEDQGAGLGAGVAAVDAHPGVRHLGGRLAAQLAHDLDDMRDAQYVRMGQHPAVG